MIITTSFTVEGRPVIEYLGIVSAAQVMALPGGNKGVQRGWQTGVEGADAVIAARFEPFGSNICATGTAVRLG